MTGAVNSVVAHYSGDGTFAQSDSPAVLVSVSQESSKTFVSLVTFDPKTGGIASNSASTAAYGSPYIMRIDVTNSSNTLCSGNLENGTIPPINTIPCPTGNVTVTDNGAPFNDFLNTNTGVTSNGASLNAQGYFEDQPIQLPAGNHSFVASYAGDNSYNASTSAADAVAITKASSTIKATAAGSASINQTIPITGTIDTTSNGAGSTGIVTFMAGAVTLGTAPVVGTAADPHSASPATGFAILPASFSAAGTKSITTTYSGDANYAASGPSAAITVNVTNGPASGNYTITATPVTVTAGGSGVSTITATPGAGATPGDVQITCPGTGLPPGVSCTPNPLTITVTGATPATGVLTISVAAPSTSLSASRTCNQTSQYATVAALLPGGSSAQNASRNGWWTFSASTGFGALLLFLLPGLRGRKQIRAALGLALVSVLSLTLGCGGGSSSAGGGGGAVATHTSISVSTAKLPSAANNFAFNVTVTSTGAAPTGQVQLFEDGTALGLPAPVSNGTVSVTTGLGAVGTHSVAAHYLGTATTMASASGALSLTVTGTTTLPLTTTPAGSGNISLTIQ